MSWHFLWCNYIITSICKFAVIAILIQANYDNLPLTVYVYSQNL